MSGKLTVSVVTPERVVFEGAAESVVAPAFDGELGILPGHAPFVTLLGSGELRVRGAGADAGNTGRDAPAGGEAENKAGEPRRTAIRGGFLQVHGNVVRVLTEEAVSAEELDRAALDKEAAELADRTAEQAADAEAAAQRREERTAWLRARRRLLERDAAQ